VPNPLILITRPHDAALETAQLVKKMGFDTLLAPALRIQDTNQPLPDLSAAEGLIFSSAEGVRALMRQNPAPVIFSKTIFAVGDHTAQMARDAGFECVLSAAGTMTDLAALIRQHYVAPVALVHISGADTQNDPALLLPRSEGWHVERIIVYRAVPIDHIPTEALTALRAGQVYAIVFYSARSAEGFLNALIRDWPQAICPKTRALCLAPPVIECVRKFNLQWADIFVSKTPEQAGILALLETLDDHDKRQHDTSSG
jgi:uroporphyrinogen-III synthase